jgi:hypothetical protein
MGQVARGSCDFLGGGRHLLGGRGDLLRHRGGIVRVVVDRADQLLQPGHHLDHGGREAIEVRPIGPVGQTQVSL